MYAAVSVLHICCSIYAAVHMHCCTYAVYSADSYCCAYAAVHKLVIAVAYW